MKNITFVNAGAGSGKTHYLTQMLTRNVSAHQCRADEVILTTFTDKAATEFKNKAREALLSSGQPDQANLLASAAMGTIHSVALQFIQKYWYYLGVGIKLNVMPKEDVDFFINQSLAFVPDLEEIKELSRLTKTLNFVDAYSAENHDQWKSDLLSIIQLALNNQIGDLEACKKDSLDEIDQIFPVTNEYNLDNKDLQNILPDLLESLRKLKQSAATDNRIIKVENFIQLKGKFGLKEHLDFQTLLSDLPKNVITAVAASEGIQNQLAFLHHSPLLVIPVKEYVELLYTLSIRSLTQLKTYKQEHKLIDYNDMEILFLELLKIPEVAEEISSRYKMVFVDEFQDSSPIQVEIFSRLSDMANHSYWVGDPKQAIYNFRGTDPLLIDAIINELSTKDERNFSIENLGDSWRSRPQIVHLTNNIFTKALSDQVKEAYIALNPIRTAHELPNNNDHHALQHWHFSDTIGKGKNEHFAHHLASEIKTLLKDKVTIVVDKSRSKYDKDPSKHQVKTRDLKPEDIAILCRKLVNVETCASALKGFGLEVAAEQDNLIQTAEMKLFMALLNYHLDRNDTLAKATVLLLTDTGETAGSLIDNRLEFLYGENAVKAPGNEEEDQTETALKYYKYLSGWGNENEILRKADLVRQQSGHLSVSSLVEKLIAITGLSDLVLRWDNPIQRKNNLQAIKKMARHYEDRSLLMEIGVSVRGFIEYLSVYDSSGFKQGAASGVEAVNIMTYHKSKGLEWPVVILTELDDEPLIDAKLINLSFFNVHLDNRLPIDLNNPFKGKSIIVMPWPFGSRRKKISADLRNAIVENERYKRLSDSAQKEMKRLLYVGMTRARDLLITTSYRNDKPTWMNDVLGHQNLEVSIESLNNGCQYIDLFSTGDPIAATKFDYGDDAEFPKAEPQTDSIFTKDGPCIQNSPMFQNPSKAFPVADIKFDLAADFSFRIQLGAGLKQRENELGDCLHEAFYLFRPNTDRQLIRNTMSEVIDRHGLTGELPLPDHVVTSIYNLYDFLRSVYGYPVKVYRELPLQQFKNGIVYKGEADLVWETTKGLILIDYKSYPGSIGNITNPAHEKFSGKYSGQLARYKEMIDNSHPEGKKVIETLIYYAVFGAIVRLYL